MRNSKKRIEVDRDCCTISLDASKKQEFVCHADPPEIPNPVRRSNHRQYYSAITANIGSFTIGNAWSWSATAFPSLEETSDIPNMHSTQYSWIASIIFLGAMLACPLSSYFVHLFGLRKSMLALVVPLLAGWLLIAFAQNFEMLLVGRFITGFCSGGVSFAAPAFVAETTNPEIRGKLGFAYYFMFSTGVLYIFVVGAFVSWRWQAGACALIPIVFYLMMFFVPESPRSLVVLEKDDKAIESLRWYRNANNPDEVLPELNEIKKTEATNKALYEVMNWPQEFKLTMKLKGVWIAIFLQFFLQMCGEVPVLAFTVDIFRSAGTDDSNLATIVVGSTQVISTVVGSFLVDKYGRRILLMLSEIFMALSLIGLGLFTYFRTIEGYTILNQFSWIPMACLIIFITSFAFGIGPLPWVAIGEILGGLPLSTKGIATTIATMLNRFLGFLALYFFRDLVQLIGDYGSYWFFAGFNIIGVAYIFWNIPETKGKSLEEIQILLNTKSAKVKGDLNLKSEP